MADVQDADANAEPSMEEILASIRRIIADEKDPNAAEAPVSEENALELTQMVQEDGSIVDVSSVPETTLPEPMPEPPAAVAPPEEPKPAPPPPPEEPTELVSAPAADSAASSLAALANTVQIEKAAAMPAMSRTPLGRDNRTLEEMVLELMKPMLKAWLDENLPAIVERLVQKEVERIARRVSE